MKQQCAAATRQLPVLLVALLLSAVLGLSGCSRVSSSHESSLPISAASDSGSVHPTRCTLSSSGNSVEASGTFRPAPTLLRDQQGHQLGANELQLDVVGKGNVHVGHLVVRSPTIAHAVAGVSVGQTSWRLGTHLMAWTNARPSRCLVTLLAFTAGP